MKLCTKYSFEGEYSGEQVALALELLILNKGYCILSHNETGRYAKSVVGNEKALWEIIPHYKDEVTEYRWVCWLQNDDEILKEAANVLSLPELNRIVSLGENGNL